VTLMDWLCGQLRRPSAGGRGVAPAVWALATLLRERSLRGTFLAAGGPALLVPLLRVPAGAPANIQVRRVSLPRTRNSSGPGSHAGLVCFGCGSSLFQRGSSKFTPRGNPEHVR